MHPQSKRANDAVACSIGIGTAIPEFQLRRHGVGFIARLDSRHVSGQDYGVESFGVDEATGLVDYEDALARARAFLPHCRK